jgi:predicted ATPase/class 3 adenylate cyclase
VQVDILGPLVVSDDSGTVVELSAPKWRAVLSLLALYAGAPVSVERICRGVWGDDYDLADPKGSVKGYVSQLNTTLGKTISQCPGGYRLDADPEDVDAARFERLLKESEDAHAAGDWRTCVERGRLAAKLWRGEPLPDLHPDSFARGDITRLEELHEAGEDRVFEARLALGGYESLIGDLEAAVIRKPEDEKRWGLLMLALYRSGRQRDALEAYQRLCRVLADYGLGQPTQRVRMLEAQMVAQDPALLDLPTEPDLVTEAERPRLPEGNVTFLFSEADGSERLAARLPLRYPALLAEHHRVIRLVVANLGGVEVEMVGDALFFAFSDASRAVQACLEAQQALVEVDWPHDAELKAQMGVDTCIARPDDQGGYESEVVHQTARVCTAAHGGQVLLSANTADIVRKYLPPDASLVDRGPYMLSGFDEPERLYQLVHPSLEASFPPLRASPAQSHNLPDMRTSFVGRESDLKAIDDLVSSSRMVTIWGAGGIGKTRLAVEAAARLVEHFPWGVRLCDLSPIEDPSVVDVAIVGAFGLRGAEGADPLESIIDVLGTGPALLMMDGCEHLHVAAARAINRLLAGAPGLRVLATSREPLGLADERLYPLEPLEVPDADAGLNAVRDSDAAILFETRARLARPDFTVTEPAAPDVAAICRHLGGLPLAIELVAAQMATLSTSVIAERLESGSPVGQRVSADGTERHRSLESTIDWSYQLLDEEARTLLRYLSVFANGFTIDAARRISDAADPVGVLTQLVEKSLVVFDHDATRYRILEPIRAFARKRLEAAGEDDRAGERHLKWCAAFAASLRTGHTAKETHELFDRELDNFRIALAWGAAHATAQGVNLAEVVQVPVEAMENEPPAPTFTGSPGPGWEWEAVVEADHDHYDRVELEVVEAFPLDVPARRFPLTGEVVRIGRRRGSGGPVPEIDLSSAPQDPGISREHALLIRQDDGWAIVDDKSTNGVFLNDSVERLPQAKVIRVGDGDRLRLGAWTAVTIRRV